MQRKKLVLFAGGNPAISTRPAFMAYHFASVAHRSGIEAGVRLAGDAVESLINCMNEAVESGLFVSV